MGPATNALLRTVGQMMSRFGGDATLVVTGEESYNVETSEVETVETQYTIRVVAFDYTQNRSGLAAKDGTLIRTGDKQLFIKPDSAVPVPREGVDKIIFEGRPWTVITIKSHNPSGTLPYVYEAYVRA